MKQDKDQVRDELAAKLLDNRVFWSYQTPVKESIPDEILIEKTLVHLDLEDISRLFQAFPRSMVRKVWIDRVIPDDRLYSLNLLFSYLYFGISKPEEYLNRKRREHFRKLEGTWKD